MSQEDSRVVAEVVDALGSGILIPSWIGTQEEPLCPLGTKLVPFSLLTEAESNAEESSRRAVQHSQHAAKLSERVAALQSRLDAVVGLLGETRAYVDTYYAASIVHRKPTELHRNLINRIDELRAALGGESPANDEERK